jgi:hypothetical protein
MVSGDPFRGGGGEHPLVPGFIFIPVHL